MGESGDPHCEAKELKAVELPREKKKKGKKKKKTEKKVVER